ncbi:hypothetical protein [Rhizobium tumorigenes]|uniref:hypothetical protein n=1 Tax=Rhizobium tumorigenes TaxID=2041385 RepID=UPI00241C0828|nr:hypothetical protein [Rhizobium tumorigenes]WFS02203.1 hypothetical protein PR016_06210 [Rhizobium tumorigenes]
MTKPPKIQAGKKSAHAHFLDAVAALDEQKAIADPEPNTPRNGIGPGKWDGAPHDAMPPGCPITVLGMKGDSVYVISATGILHEVTRWDQPNLIKLFAPYTNYLFWAWPAFGKSEGVDEEGNPRPPKVKRLERDKAITAIITEAGRKGIFDPQDNVRGRGGWKAQDKFIWHSGTMLWSVDVETDKTNFAKSWKLQVSKPAEYDGHFYKRDSDTIKPWQEPVSANESPAHQLLQDLMTWNWERPYLDPLLLLGWIASGFMGAALDVRPIVFTTGGAGVGKSTLHNVIKAIYGPVLYSTANTTAAGIYQNIGQDSRPVAVDELEAKSGSYKEQGIIELSRQSYSGAKLYRGGSNHEGVEFELRSSFLFSAILHPPLSHQDKTRMAILNLSKLNKGHGRHPVIPDFAGRMILRQIMDGFHDFNWHILPKWKKLLASPRLNFDARAIDTYGTLMACCELLVGESGMIDAGMRQDDVLLGKLDMDHLIDSVAVATAGDMAEQQEKWEDVITRVLSTTIDQYKGGEKMSVGNVLQRLEEKILEITIARDMLATVGLGIRDRGSPRPGYCLGIPFSCPKVDRVFEATDYLKGGWTLALKQAPETVVVRGLDKAMKTIKINRMAKHCTIVDLKGYDDWAEPEGAEQ